MKNLIIIIFILSILFTQSSFAEINGKINERVDDKLIVEFFENYTHFKINNKDIRKSLLSKFTDVQFITS